jgi:hypothetical protein
VCEKFKFIHFCCCGFLLLFERFPAVLLKERELCIALIKLLPFNQHTNMRFSHARIENLIEKSQSLKKVSLKHQG